MTVVFTAGTPEEAVCIAVSDGAKVMVFTDHRIFHHNKKNFAAVRTWKAEIPGTYCGLATEIKRSSSLEWVLHEEEPSCTEMKGSSRLLLASLREAVRLYVEKHPPISPEDANDLALLKVASHWCWGQPEASEAVDRNDQRIVKAARFALEHWKEELEKLKAAELNSSTHDEPDSGLDDSHEEAEIEILEDIVSIELFLDSISTMKETCKREQKQVSLPTDLHTEASLLGQRGRNFKGGYRNLEEQMIFCIVCVILFFITFVAYLFLVILKNFVLLIYRFLDFLILFLKVSWYGMLMLPMSSLGIVGIFDHDNKVKISEFSLSEGAERNLPICHKNETPSSVTVSRKPKAKTN